MSTAPLLIAMIVAVVLAGLLSAVEAALSRLSTVRAAELREAGRVGAVRLERIVEDASRYLNSTLFLRVAFETIATVLAVLIFLQVFDDDTWAAVVAAAVMVGVLYVLVGVGTRTLGRQHAESVALVMSGPVAVLTGIIGPVARLLIIVGNALTPGRGFSDGPFASEAELRELVDMAEANDLIEDDERQMIHSVFELGDTITREVMVPRTDIVYIERHKTLRQAMSLLLRSGFSRVPVMGQDLDDILGFVYLKDVARRVFDRKDAETTETVEQHMRPVDWVPDTKPADDLLRQMQARRRHVAVVVDEYGGTAGMVTIEDILEEIVGEITDEFDTGEVTAEQLQDDLARVPARYPIDDLVDLLGVELDDDEVDSVGGLMAKHLGKVPIPGAKVVVDGLEFVAEEATGRRNRVGTVLVRRL